MTAPASALVPVMAMPQLDPGAARLRMDVAEGATLLEIVRLALPGLAETELPRLRVTLVTDRGVAAPPPASWRRIRPRAGVHVLVRVVPGDDQILRSVLLVAIAIAAVAVAGPIAGALLPAGASAGALAAGAAVVGAGLTIAGTLLVNALIPPPQADRQERRNVYSVGGWRNDLRPDEAIPCLFGRHRYAPPFAAPAYTEIVGDRQYVRGLFCFGYGRMALSDFRLGDTPIDEFEDVELEVREGTPADLPVSLYPRQVLEEQVNAELVRPLPRDDAGEVIPGDPAVATPIVRHTASDTARVSLILAFGAGLFVVNGKGKLLARTVEIRIRQRPETGGAWTDVTTLRITARQRETFWRQHAWDLPSRGRWEIEVTRMTDEDPSMQVSDRCTLAGVQSIRPEYPVAFGKPLAMVALRIRATHQLNGALDAFNAIGERYMPHWDGESWGDAPSRNPASAFVEALQGPANAFPAPDAEIDWEGIADWHAWCAAKGLRYNRVHEADETLGEMLTAICAAGRASWRHDGLTWGVVIDRPQTLAVDHISGRNAAQVTWSRTYLDPPDAVRVRFIDETNGWTPAQMLAPWPGHEGPINLVEEIEHPGKTSPAENWIETRRRQYELIYRPDRIRAIQEGAARVATRGDLVMAAFDTLARTYAAARVIKVSGRSIELDEVIDVSAAVGAGCAIRFRVFDEENEDDSIGVSVVSRCAPSPASAARTRAFRVALGATMPALGDLVHVGLAGTDSLELRVRYVEGGERLSSVMHFVAAAPEIDALTDAEVPPVWSPRVGAIADIEAVAPTAPRFVEILSGRAGTDDPNGLVVRLEAGTGSAALLDVFEVRHRLDAASEWTVETVPVADGGLAVAGYALGDDVVLQARALASDGTAGPWGATVALEIGGDDSPIPSALDADAVEVAGDLGCVRITLAATADDATEQVQVYLAPSGDPLNRELHALGRPFATLPGATLSYVLGDGTRRNKAADPGFDDPSAWETDDDWAVSGGVGQHTAGDADAIRQDMSLNEGATFRIAFTVSGRTAGSVAPRLSGGTVQTGAAVTADGLALDALMAAAGNDAFGFVASSDFDGAVDDVAVFRATGRCLASGVFDVWLEPQDDSGVPGPVSGPFTVTVL